jgi:hypothetical protein
MIPRPPSANPTDVSAPSMQPMGDTDGKMSGEQAGYIELDGAQKDADCMVVMVDGGVSSDMGICRQKFDPQDGATAFNCGSCNYVEPGQQQMPGMDVSGGNENQAEGVGDGS